MHCVFPTICGSRGSKSRLTKAVGAEPAGQIRDKKFHADVVRSTCPSQNIQNPQIGQRLEVEMSKKYTPLWREMYKTDQSRTTLDVEMSKKCTPLWRKVHFQVKSVKNCRFRTTFGCPDVEKVHTN